MLAVEKDVHEALEATAVEVGFEPGVQQAVHDRAVVRFLGDDVVVAAREDGELGLKARCLLAGGAGRSGQSIVGVADLLLDGASVSLISTFHLPVIGTPHSRNPRTQPLERSRPAVQGLRGPSLYLVRPSRVSTATAVAGGMSSGSA